jgi:hypothetical protein
MGSADLSLDLRYTLYAGYCAHALHTSVSLWDQHTGGFLVLGIWHELRALAHILATLLHDAS